MLVATIVSPFDREVLFGQIRQSYDLGLLRAACCEVVKFLVLRCINVTTVNY